jgi:hypothetical protein
MAQAPRAENFVRNTSTKCSIAFLPESHASAPYRTRLLASLLVKTLIDRADRLRSSRVGPSTDMLKISGDGRKAALDMRLVYPFAGAHGDSKLRVCWANRAWRLSPSVILSRRTGCEAVSKSLS